MNTTIAGIPIEAYGGMIVGFLILIQVLGGLKVFKMPLSWHKVLGIAILALALLHGLWGLSYYFAI